MAGGLLLDTHVVLWWLADDPTLSADLKTTIDQEVDVFVSAATVWEVAIKQSLGKLKAPDDLAEQIRDGEFRNLPITSEHVIAASRLPAIHRDPFDRVLVAQAQADGLTLVTRDRVLPRYGLAVLTA
ncbi:MAG TPA: type II toxin-antitoxin system VapC family toxin [Acidimicrobiales bacterium]